MTYVGNEPVPPSLVLVKAGTFQRDLAAAAGNQAIVGVGFRPRALMFLATKAFSSITSWGLSDGLTSKGFGQNTPGGADTSFDDTGRMLFLTSANNAYQSAIVASMDADGFTLNWAKVGAPAGIVDIAYLAFG